MQMLRSSCAYGSVAYFTATAVDVVANVVAVAGECAGDAHPEQSGRYGRDVVVWSRSPCNSILLKVAGA